MSAKNKTRTQRKRRAKRVSTKIRMSAWPRVSVYRSLKHLYAQVIDDTTGSTLAHSSTQMVEELSGDKSEQAKAVGIALAKQAKEKGIERVSFDRGAYRYHGRVAALATGLREGGLQV